MDQPPAPSGIPIRVTVRPCGGGEREVVLTFGGTSYTLTPESARKVGDGLYRAGCDAAPPGDPRKLSS